MQNKLQTNKPTQLMSTFCRIFFIGSKMETVIYIVCSSGVTLVMTLCLVTLKRKITERKATMNVQTFDKRETEQKNANDQNKAEYHNERDYDIIDECQIFEIPRQSPNDVHSSLAKTDLNLSDGYLVPYQAMIPDPVVHDYCTAKQSGETDPIQYINTTGEHVLLLRMQENNASQNFSSPLCLDNNNHLKRSDYISMH